MESFLEKISEIVWGNYLIIILICVGIFFTILTKFIQIRGFKLAVKETLKNDENIDSEGNLTPFQALCTALSSCIGNGNIVGVATAIASGGPGAIFWMWVSGFLGMATKYSEIVLGMIYREKDSKGNYVGGPMYYLSKGLGWKKIALLFSLFMFFQICGGALIQSNAVSLVMRDMFGVKPVISGIIMSIIIFLVVNGGIKRLGKVSEKLIPIMALIYIVGGSFVILKNNISIFNILETILKEAFKGSSIAGGVLGEGMRRAMRYGLARGLYSNEAGEGSAPVLHSTAKNSHPAKQGLLGVIEVFIDTIVMCNFTALIVLSSNVIGKNISPALYVMESFSKVGYNFRYVVGISMILFAFSTILSQWYFGKVTLTYIFDDKKAEYFKYAFLVLAIIGATTSLEIVWLIQDIILGIMILPNLVGIVMLSKDVKYITSDFFRRKNVISDR